MKTVESIIRIVLGAMLFVLWWFHTLNYITISESKNIVFLMMIISIYLLITGSARICPLKELLKIGEK